ncbi:hypothetical protein SUGI_1474830 [Cryptomeria japonica]|uniref:Uncharacterized protein n=1 Tax=Cryptomeria japonica TaxID=3369 RepID=A0AAD3RRL7_CRYJA|nr:hypothetical protein SUGI_1474830 [Cryptomeria japonica]
MGLGTHLWSLGPILHPETCVLVLVPILGAHLAPSAHPGQTERLGARGKIERAPEAPRTCTKVHSAHMCTHVGRAVCTPDALARCAHRAGLTLGERGALREGGCAPRRGWVAGVDSHVGSRFAKYTLRQAHNGCDHTSVSAPDPIRTPQLSALGPE